MIVYNRINLARVVPRDFDWGHSLFIFAYGTQHHRPKAPQSGDATPALSEIPTMPSVRLHPVSPIWPRVPPPKPSIRCSLADVLPCSHFVLHPTTHAITPKPGVPLRPLCLPRPGSPMVPILHRPLHQMCPLAPARMRTWVLLTAEVLNWTPWVAWKRTRRHGKVRT